jgi:hypothetical protein
VEAIGKMGGELENQLGWFRTGGKEFETVHIQNALNTFFVEKLERQMTKGRDYF